MTKILVLSLITILLAFSPLSNFLTLEINLAKGADQKFAQNEKEDEGDEADEGDDEADDGQEYTGDDVQKAKEGQATNGKEEQKKDEQIKNEMAKPENPPSEEAMPKPSEITPPIEPETKSIAPPAPPRGPLKAKKPPKPAKEKPKAKAKEKAKPKKAKDKPKEKSKAKSKKAEKPANGKGMKTVKSNCNMRSKPDQGAKKLGMLDPGQKIKAEPSGKKWFKIKHKGKPAYVSQICFK